jgi:hypothetical protein
MFRFASPYVDTASLPHIFAQIRAVKKDISGNFTDTGTASIGHGPRHMLSVEVTGHYVCCDRSKRFGNHDAARQLLRILGLQYNECTRVCS